MYESEKWGHIYISVWGSLRMSIACQNIIRDKIIRDKLKACKGTTILYFKKLFK